MCLKIEINSECTSNILHFRSNKDLQEERPSLRKNYVQSRHARSNADCWHQEEGQKKPQNSTALSPVGLPCSNLYLFSLSQFML